MPGSDVAEGPRDAARLSQTCDVSRDSADAGSGLWEASDAGAADIPIRPRSKRTEGERPCVLEARWRIADGDVSGGSPQRKSFVGISGGSQHKSLGGRGPSADGGGNGKLTNSTSFTPPSVSAFGGAGGDTSSRDSVGVSTQSAGAYGNSPRWQGARPRSASSDQRLGAPTARPLHRQPCDESVTVSESSAKSSAAAGHAVGTSSGQQGKAHGAAATACAASAVRSNDSDESGDRQASRGESGTSRQGPSIGEDSRHSLILQWRKQTEAQTLPDAKPEDSLSVGSSIDTSLLSEKDDVRDHESVQSVFNLQLTSSEICQTPHMQHRAEAADAVAVLPAEDSRLQRMRLLAQPGDQPPAGPHSVRSLDEAHLFWEDRWAMQRASDGSSSETVRSESAASQILCQRFSGA